MAWTIPWIVMSPMFGAWADNSRPNAENAAAPDYVQQNNNLHHLREFETATEANKAGSAREH
jgi:hypothetical protein